MKPLIFCLLSVCCFSLVLTIGLDLDLQKRKLQQVRDELIKFQRSLKDKEKKVITPPKNIEDCCCLSALTCFRENLKVHFNIPDKLYRSLANSITIRGLNFCNTTNATACGDCVSHPEERAEEFFNRLDSLIQRGITRLSMK